MDKKRCGRKLRSKGTCFYFLPLPNGRPTALDALQEAKPAIKTTLDAPAVQGVECVKRNLLPGCWMHEWDKVSLTPALALLLGKQSSIFTQ